MFKLASKKRQRKCIFLNIRWRSGVTERASSICWQSDSIFTIMIDHYLIVNILLLVENGSHFVRITIEASLNQRRLQTMTITITSDRNSLEHWVAYRGVEVGPTTADHLLDCTNAVVEAGPDESRCLRESDTVRPWCTTTNHCCHYRNKVLQFQVFHANRHHPTTSEVLCGRAAEACNVLCH